MILDLGLPGIGGRALLEKCTQEQLAVPPVVIYSGRDLTDEDNLALKEYTDSIVIKGTRAPERLMDEVTLFLHSVQSGVSRTKQAALSPAGETDTGLAGHTVLVVDDDMRNAFALSKVLRAKGLKVLVAQDGHKALSQLNGAPEIDVVLMDIMMPGMDGYTAIKEIRKQDKFRALPVIALTAKAMVGDREKCIQAGASDYLSKPVDIDALLAALRIQLKVA
jgi:CheY-like chemotaxis protein